MTIIEINALTQVVNITAKAVQSISNKIKQGTDSILLASFDCEGCNRNGEFIITALLYNNSDKNIADLDICVDVNGELISLINSVFLPKEKFVKLDVLRGIVFMSGDFKTYSWNRKYNIDEKEKFIFRIDDTNYEIELDIRDVISKKIGI